MKFIPVKFVFTKYIALEKRAPYGTLIKRTVSLMEGNDGVSKGSASVHNCSVESSKSNSLFVLILT